MRVGYRRCRTALDVGSSRSSRTRWTSFGWVQEAMDNVAVVVEDRPPADDPDLLGLYEDRQTDREFYAGALPDGSRCTAPTIEAEAGDDDEELRATIAETVVHEIAHHFGISDERLEALGWD